MALINPYSADLSFGPMGEFLIEIPHVAEIHSAGIERVRVERHPYFMTKGPKDTGALKEIEQVSYHVTLGSAIRILWEQDHENPKSKLCPARFSDNLMGGGSDQLWQ